MRYLAIFTLCLICAFPVLASPVHIRGGGSVTNTSPLYSHIIDTLERMDTWGRTVMPQCTYHQLLALHACSGIGSQMAFKHLNIAPRTLAEAWDELAPAYIHALSKTHSWYTQSTCRVLHREGVHIVNFVYDTCRLTSRLKESHHAPRDLLAIITGVMCGMYAQQYIEPKISHYIEHILKRYGCNDTFQQWAALLAPSLMTWCVQTWVVPYVADAITSAQSDSSSDRVRLFSMGITFGSDIGMCVDDSTPIADIVRSVGALNTSRIHRHRHA